MRTMSALIITAGIAATWATPCDADAVLDWNFNAGEAAKAACLSPAPNPFHESRMYAMAHIAVHDALNAIQRRYESYAFEGIVAPGTSAEAAVAAAARDAMVSAIEEIPDIFGACIPGALARVEADYSAALAAIPDGDPKDQGIALGQASAAAVIALRAGDGSDTEFLDFAYVEGTAPGEYRFFDGVPFAAAPGWGQVTPFALQSSGQFLPQPPYPVSCARPGAAQQQGSCRQYAADLAEVQAMGGNDASTHGRSPEQTQIAHFWIESSPLAWNRMGRAASGDAQLDMWDNARLFALLNMGLADGYIASMNTKYHYAFWRPVTAIHLAGEDGNPQTVENPDWAPLDPTPQVPDYESAHAVEGAVAAEIFRRVFQTDHASLSLCSLTLPNPDTHCEGAAEVKRSFTRFSDAARENGESRILVGYHFRLAVEEGLKHGRKIGAETVGKHLRPAR
jgi:hypothetical protein